MIEKKHTGKRVVRERLFYIALYYCKMCGGMVLPNPLHIMLREIKKIELFLSPYEIPPPAPENKYLRNVFFDDKIVCFEYSLESPQ